MIHLTNIIRTVDSKKSTVSWSTSSGRKLGMLHHHVEHADDEPLDCTDDGLDEHRLGWTEYFLLLVCSVVWISVASFLFMLPSM